VRNLAVNREEERAPLTVLQSVFGFDSFRGQQLAIIEHVTAGGDAVVLMPTGGGKSLCYQVPALLRPGLGVVVSPLIALMKDQVDALRQAGVRAAALNSRLSPGEAAEIEHEVRSAALDLLYVSPERLVTPRCLELLSCTPRSFCRGRSALRIAMGSRLPSGISAALDPQRALSRRPAPGFDRDRG
jgi:superfamily II DNA helicase RecQ